MDLRRAFLSGVGGGLVATVMLAACRAMGVALDAEKFVGQLLIKQDGPAAYAVGFVVLLVVYGCLGFLHAAPQESRHNTMGALASVPISLVVALLSGVFVALLPADHGSVQLIRFFADNALLGSVGFLAVHLAYGSVAGALYGPLWHAWLMRNAPEHGFDDGYGLINPPRPQ